MRSPTEAPDPPSEPEDTMGGTIGLVILIAAVVIVVLFLLGFVHT